jgi:type II secretory pathway pseudopilin PulG
MLVELVLVIALIVVFIALLIPAVQAARESAERMESTENLRTLGRAIGGAMTALEPDLRSAHEQLQPGLSNEDIDRETLMSIQRTMQMHADETERLLGRVQEAFKSTRDHDERDMLKQARRALNEIKVELERIDHLLSSLMILRPRIGRSGN